jgi:hypothetical protein
MAQKNGRDIRRQEASTVVDAQPDPLSPAEAAAAIRDTRGLDAMLRRRTSGLMWMLWGLITPGIFMTFGFASASVDGFAWWIPLLWVPWAVLGIGMTAMLWRSVRLVLPMARQRPRREVVSHVLLFLVVVVGSAWTTVLLDLPVHPPAVALGGLGVVSMLFGIFGILTEDAIERRVRFLTGLGLVIVAGLIMWLVPGLTAIVFITGAVAALAAFYGSGLWMVLRG